MRSREKRHSEAAAVPRRHYSGHQQQPPPWPASILQRGQPPPWLAQRSIVSCIRVALARPRSFQQLSRPLVKTDAGLVANFARQVPSTVDLCRATMAALRKWMQTDQVLSDSMLGRHGGRCSTASAFPCDFEGVALRARSRSFPPPKLEPSRALRD